MREGVRRFVFDSSLILLFGVVVMLVVVRCKGCVEGRAVRREGDFTLFRLRLWQRTPREMFKRRPKHSCRYETGDKGRGRNAGYRTSGDGRKAEVLVY